MIKKKPQYIDLPIEQNIISNLELGDIVYLNGNIMTARDHAHKKIIELHREKHSIPKKIIEMKNTAIYHCGPIVHETSEKDTMKFNLYSGGPTTSARMEPYQKEVCNILDIRIVIGKGGMKNLDFSTFKSVYLSFTGGCGAIFKKFTKNIEDVIWLEEFGMPEAVWIINVENFGPLIVSQDTKGNSLY